MIISFNSKLKVEAVDRESEAIYHHILYTMRSTLSAVEKIKNIKKFFGNIFSFLHCSFTRLILEAY